jgi:antitoxin MazE
MQISKWGNSLSVRLPKDVVEALGLKEGDDVAAAAQDSRAIAFARNSAREKALKELLSLKWPLPENYRFDRDEAHERG